MIDVGWARCFCCPPAQRRWAKKTKNTLPTLQKNYIFTFLERDCVTLVNSDVQDKSWTPIYWRINEHQSNDS